MIQRMMLVIRHAWQMWRVLSHKKNRSKGDWRGMDNGQLLLLALGELKELKAALLNGEPASRVAEESGDVSAYVAMIADNARRRT